MVCYECKVGSGSFARYVIVGMISTVAGVAIFALLYWIFEDTVNVNVLLMIK